MMDNITGSANGYEFSNTKPTKIVSKEEAKEFSKEKYKELLEEQTRILKSLEKAQERLKKLKEKYNSKNNYDAEILINSAIKLLKK